MRPSLFAAAALFGAACMLPASQARAATEKPFTEQAFKASEHAGQPILVHVSAPWCPTCARQQPILNTLAADPRFAHLVIYKVDFDHQKAAVRAFHAQMQSTLIAFHGTTEEARSVGDTNPASIAALVGKTLG